MSNPSEILAQLDDLPRSIGESLGERGGFLRCDMCRTQIPMTTERAERSIAEGWPQCCGYTMRWWTQRQIDAGEIWV